MNIRRQVSCQSKSFVQKQRSRIVWSWILAIICLVSVVFAVSRLTSLPSLEIDRVEIVGAGADIELALRAIVLRTISGSYLGLFPRANTYIYPESQIRSAILGASPRILTANVFRDGLRSLIVKVGEKPAVAVVCAGLPDWSGPGLEAIDYSECYLVDVIGTILKRADPAEAANLNTYYLPDMTVSTSSADWHFGTLVATTTEFQALQSFYTSANRRGIPVRAGLWRGGGEYELYTEDGPTGSTTADGSGIAVIYLNERNDLADELNNLVSFWNRMHEGSSPVFEYIDLRYGSNVFYRMVR